MSWIIFVVHRRNLSLAILRSWCCDLLQSGKRRTSRKIVEVHYPLTSMYACICNLCDFSFDHFSLSFRLYLRSWTKRFSFYSDCFPDISQMRAHKIDTRQIVTCFNYASFDRKWLRKAKKFVSKGKNYKKNKSEKSRKLCWL
jgi:hypothetical protein